MKIRGMGERIGKEKRKKGKGSWLATLKVKHRTSSLRRRLPTPKYIPHRHGDVL